MPLEWSASADWLAWGDPTGLMLTAADGSGAPHRVNGPCAAYAFARGGKTLYLVRRAKDRHWELASLSVPEGAETSVTTLNIPAEREIHDMSLHPDGKRITLSVGTVSRDIWMLDGFDTH